ncbi:MAG: T9SS type A sorting domain-containing protein [Bacteroidetes bacterium]|nr:T9SS type A sorting domain-containing protein [Bacteroidota bacterium]
MSGTGFQALASSSSSGTASTATSTGTGSTWYDEDDAKTVNGWTAYGLLNASTNTNFLMLTNYGFSIPSTATITGIEVTIKRSAIDAGVIRDHRLYLTKDASSNSTSDYSDRSTFYGTSLSDATYGGSSDLWGTTWTFSEINSPNFGVKLKCRNTSGSYSELDVDCITIIVHYTTPSSSSPGGVSTSLELWLKADTSVTGTTNVSAWGDVSGNGHSATQSNSSKQPELTTAAINFNDAVTFNGTSDFLDIAFNSDLNPDNFTIFSVHQVAGGNAYRSPITSRNDQSGQPTEGYIMYLDANGEYEFWTGQSAGSWGYQQSGDYTSGKAEIASIMGEKSSSSLIKNMYLNGENIAGPSTQAFVKNASQSLRIGAGQTESTTGMFFWNGPIAEQIVYSGTITDAERKKITSYLAIKYGVSLPHNYVNSNGDIIWNYGANSNYSNHIIGIGQDDNSDLNQKQSKTDGSNAELIVALGSIATSNAANSNSFGADQSFLILGSDNAALTGAGVTDFGTTTNAENIDARIARIWKLNETGTVGSVRLKFDLTNFPGVKTHSGTYDYSKLRLLIDADSVFASGAYSLSPTTYSSSDTTIEFDYNFSSGVSFISIGTLDESGNAPLPVEFTYFKAESVGSLIELEWGTSMELDNDKFEIQHSLNGVKWSKLDEVAGYGTTDVDHTYNWLHENPMVGLNYYRLKQVDFNGEFEYSPVVSAKISDGLVNKATLVSLFPNPVVSMLQFDLDMPNDVQGIATIVNQNGSVEQTELLRFLTGTHNYKLDLERLQPGIYQLIIQVNDEKIQKQIVKI